MHINYFVTKKEYRKKGLGGELLDTMENLAKKENLNSLDLNVDFYDYKIINFYKNKGFMNEKILISKRL